MAADDQTHRERAEQLASTADAAIYGSERPDAAALATLALTHAVLAVGDELREKRTR